MRLRIRTVKPELFLNEELVELEEQTGWPMRLAFIGLWLCCDREGRFEWRPMQIKALLFPYDGTPVDAIMEQLFYYDFIKRYRVNDVMYGYVPTFLLHQRPNHREARSLLPAPTPENIENSDHFEEPKALAPAVYEGREIPAEDLPQPGLALLPPPALNLVEERVQMIQDAKGRKKVHDKQMGAYVKVVFLYWRERMGKTGRTVLDQKRRRRIRARLTENDGDVAELLCTVDGALKDDFLMGNTDESAQKYNGIEVVFRDRGQVERLAPMSTYYGEEVHPFMEERVDG